MATGRTPVSFVLLASLLLASLTLFSFLVVRDGDEDGGFVIGSAESWGRRSLESSTTSTGFSVGMSYADPKTVSLRISSPITDRGHEDELAADEAFLSAPATWLRPYDTEAVINTVPHGTKQFFVFLYVAKTDEFVALYDKTQPWSSGARRMLLCASVVERAFRRNFPSRFRGGKNAAGNGGSVRNLPMLATVGDSPKLKGRCIDGLPLKDTAVDGQLDGFGLGEGLAVESTAAAGSMAVAPPEEYEYVCNNDGMAPILGFGSVFRDPRVLPSLVTMPMAAPPHMPCFDYWLRGLGVCPGLQPRFRLEAGGIARNEKMVDHKEGLVFGDELDLKWDDLIPSVLWRGTDFGFLLTVYPELRRPDYETDVLPHLPERREASPNEVVRALLDSFDTYLPRWKGAILTAEAELSKREGREAKEFERRHRNIFRNTTAEDTELNAADTEPRVPWCNIKFSHYIENHKKTPTSESAYFQHWEALGVHAGGNFMDMLEHARYKYHIDIGGGGGTTWTGTLLKLSLPGLLFHHETPTKDWLHDHIKPWIHYVPVKTDLSDLRAKFLWAEKYPGKARRISRRATDFMRSLGTEEGFEPIFDHYFYDNLKSIIDAYQPPPVLDPSDEAAMAADEAALDELQSRLPNHEVVMRCLSSSSRFTFGRHEGCEMYRGDKVKKWNLMRKKDWGEIY